MDSSQRFRVVLFATGSGKRQLYRKIVPGSLVTAARGRPITVEAYLLTRTGVPYQERFKYRTMILGGKTAAMARHSCKLTTSLFGGKPVSYPRFGENISGAGRIVFELSTKTRHEYSKIMRLLGIFRSPGFPE